MRLVRTLGFALTVFATFACSSEKRPTATEEEEEEEDSPRKKPKKAEPSASTSAVPESGSTIAASTAPRPVPTVAPPPPSDLAVTLKLEKTEYQKGDAIPVTFSRKLEAPPGEQYWITLVAPAAADTEFGKWQYLPQGVERFTLDAHEVGSFEVRLHDLHPRNKGKGKVLARQLIQIVDKKVATGPFVPKSGFCSADSDCPSTHYCGQQGNCFQREAPKKKKTCNCSMGKSYWGPCERTGCNAGYTCSDRDNGGDGNCYCNC